MDTSSLALTISALAMVTALASFGLNLLIYRKSKPNVKVKFFVPNRYADEVWLVLINDGANAVTFDGVRVARAGLVEPLGQEDRHGLVDGEHAIRVEAHSRRKIDLHLSPDDRPRIYAILQDGREIRARESRSWDI